MSERRGAFGTIGIILLVLFLILAAIAAYLYYFHTFKFFKACVSNEAQDTNNPCASDDECRVLFLNKSNITLEEMPQLLRDEFILILEESVYCENTCFVKEMYGDSFGTPVGSCNEGDKSFVLEIYGKDMLKMLSYYWENLGGFGKIL